ncbi:MAG: B12-binding domain-containing radical SAM protein [Oscillochloridaceae bacterium umkhey_bin13]
MQIVLISPYSGIEATGLRVLSACLKQAGHHTTMIFLPNLDEAMAGTHFDGRDLSAALRSQLLTLCAEADLIGMTVMTPSFTLACRLTTMLRQHVHTPIIWGGIHPTVRPAECLAYADLVCVGEGEGLIVDLADRMAAGQAYTDLPNLAYRDGEGNLVINPLRPLVSDLDRLPFPDYAFEQHYLLHQGALQPATTALMHYYLTDLGSWAQGPIYGVLTMRGCPYHCTYCANNALVQIYPGWSHLRRRSPASVIAEIQAVRARLPGIEAIILRDDTFLANSEAYLREFSAQYQATVGLPFRAYTTAQTADPARLQILVEAGLCYVIMGIQSGSRRVQRQYARTASNARVLQAAQVLHGFREAIPRPTYDLITDNPFETDEDRWATLQLVHQLPMPYRLSLYALTFYPGTDLERDARANGHLHGEDARAYQQNFQIVAANYYNLVLYGHSWNLPRPLLRWLTSYAALRIGSRGWVQRLAGSLLRMLLAVRLWQNQRRYVTRQHSWLGAPTRATHD